MVVRKLGKPLLTLRFQADFEVLAFGWKGNITQFCSSEEQFQDVSRLTKLGVL